MKDRHSTFPSVAALCEHLAADNPDDYLFRGQSRHYGSLLPSRLRRIAEANPSLPGWFDIPRARLIAERTAREIEISRMRDYLVSQMGPAVGNLLCQQYAVLSDVVDATEDLQTAAFFATREWPRCVHIDGAPERGVIYRWKRTDEGQPDVQNARLSLESGLVCDPTHPEGFALVRPQFAAAGSQLATRVRDAPNAIVRLRADVLTLDEMRLLISDLLASDIAMESDVARSLEAFETSRWVAQGGGLIRSDMTYPCVWQVPQGATEADIHFDEEIGCEVDRNLKVFIGEPDLVRDALEYAEAFYFEHSPVTVNCAPEALWPSTSSDRVFRQIAILAALNHKSYLEETRAFTPWTRQSGLLDRGFYTVPATSEYETAEYNEFAAFWPPPRPEPPAGVLMLRLPSAPRPPAHPYIDGGAD